MSAMKDEFLATLSHELRTPLNAILGWAQMLPHAAPQRPSELRQGLETIERNARVQTQLIEDLLDMSRITSGKLRLDVQPVAPDVVIEAAVESVPPAADAKGIRLETCSTRRPARSPATRAGSSRSCGTCCPTRSSSRRRAARCRSRSSASTPTSRSRRRHRHRHPAEFLPHVFDRFRQATPRRRASTAGSGSACRS